MSFSFLGKLPKVTFTLPKIVPRIKLPKLALPALLVYSVPKLVTPTLGALGKLGSLASSFASALTPFQQKLSSMFGSITHLSTGAALGYVGGVLNSAVKEVTTIATGLVSKAIGQATATVNEISGIFTTLDKAVVSEINKVTDLFKTQSKNVNDIITGEINLSKGNASSISQVASVTASLNASINQTTQNFSNLQLKTLSENPEQQAALSSQIAQTAINNVTKSIVDKNTKVASATNQVAAINQLNTLTPNPQPVVVNNVLNLPSFTPSPVLTII